MKNILNDDLFNTTWLGEVVDINDPKKEGRIKVKVFGKFDQLSNDDIPWCYPGTNIVSGSSNGGSFFSVPKLNSIVSVRFENGNLYHPEYFFNQKLSEDVKNEISNSYENAHIIIYDTVTDGSLKVFFTEEKGLMLDYKESQINIKDTNIIIKTRDNDTIIELEEDGNIKISTSKEINIDASKDINIESSKNINIDSKEKINIKANSDISVESKNGNITLNQSGTGQIKLGEGAVESLIKGESFLALFNLHTHNIILPIPGTPVTPPILTPMTPLQLSGLGGPKKTVVF